MRTKLAAARVFCLAVALLSVSATFSLAQTTGTASITAAQFPADSIGIDTACLGSNEPRPCGPGASYAVAGVRSGISIDEIADINSDMAYAIVDELSTTTAGTLSWTILSFDVFFEDSLEAGGLCEFDETWGVTSVEKDTDQCDLTRCTEQGSCFALDNDEVFDVAITLSDFFYTAPLQEQKAAMPFARMQTMRKKRGIDGNDDEEDGNNVYFSDNGDGSNDDDDEQSCSLGGGVTDPNASGGDGADDSDTGSCWLACTSALSNQCGSSATALSPCYSGGGGAVMHALGHLYGSNTGQYETFSTGGASKPGSNTNYGCERCLDPSISFGYVPADLVELYESGGSVSSNQIVVSEYTGDDCDLAGSSLNGCLFGPKPSEWDGCRIRGDDDEDSTDDDDASSDRDDDDDESSSNTCREGSGDGTSVHIERHAFESGIALHDRSLPPLNADLYRLLASQGFEDNSVVPFDGTINKMMQTTVGGNYAVLSCAYCSGNQGNPNFKGKRYSQLDISPDCYIYGVDPINDLVPAWNLDISVGRVPNNPLEAPDTPASFALSPMGSDRVVVNVVADSTLLAYGSGVSMTVGDQVVNSPPSSSLDSVDSVVICHDPKSNPFKNDVLASYPYDRFFNRCAGCTAMQETGIGAPKFWMTLDYETYSLLSEVCAPIYDFATNQPIAGPVGYTGGGMMDTAMGTSSGDISSNNGGVTWNMCESALNLFPAITNSDTGGANNCRPYHDTAGDGSGFISEPAYAAARSDDFYQTTGQQANSGSISVADANSAFAAHDASIFLPPNTLISPTVGTWVFFNKTTGQGHLATAPLSSREAVGGSTLELPEASFRIDVYIVSTVASVGDIMVSGEMIISADTGKTDLCPLLYPDYGGPDCSTVNANGGVFNTYSSTEVASVCGYANVRTDFSETDSDILDDNDNIFAATIRFGFTQCIAQGLVPFCLPGDDVCSFYIQEDPLPITIPSDEVTELQAGADIYFSSNAQSPPDCTSECEITLEQLFGNRWEIITSITVQSCGTSGDTAGKANCNPRPSNSPSMTPSPTKTPSTTATVGSLPSDSSTRTPTASSTPTTTPSPTSTPTKGGNPSAPDPAGSETRTPSPRESPGGLNVPNSVSPFATGIPSNVVEEFGQNHDLSKFYYWYDNRNVTCDTLFDVTCNCSPDTGDLFGCLVNLFVPWLTGAIFIICIVCCCLIACCSWYSDRKKKKNAADAASQAQATDDLYGDFAR